MATSQLIVALCDSCGRKAESVGFPKDWKKVCLVTSEYDSDEGAWCNTNGKESDLCPTCYAIVTLKTATPRGRKT